MQCFKGLTTSNLRFGFAELAFRAAAGRDDASQLKSLKKLVYDNQQDKILEL